MPPDMISETSVHSAVVVRGELFSDTGYARATRALADVMRNQVGRLFGVSLHAHRSRINNAVSFPVIPQSSLKELTRSLDVIVINVCTPDGFVRTPGAWNVGYFFWETDMFPRNAAWLASMRLMDRLWSPSTWQREAMRKATGRTDIAVVPWPQRRRGTAFATGGALAGVRAHRAMSAKELRNYELRVRPPGQSELEKEAEERAYLAGIDERFGFQNSPLLTQALADEGNTFLCVQTDAVRKGMPVLLSGWMRFKKQPEGRNARLLIKASSIDVTMDQSRLHFHLSLAVLRAAARAGVPDPNVFFVYDRLSNAQMDELFLRSDAYLTATYGEGFGGPVAEALMLGTPVIAPNHTSLGDLLPPGYRLTIAFERHALALWNNIPVYSPSSSWNIPSDASLTDVLVRFSRMPTVERQQVAAHAQEVLLARAGEAAVASVLRTEFDAMRAPPSRSI